MGNDNKLMFIVPQQELQAPYFVTILYREIDNMYTKNVFVEITYLCLGFWQNVWSDVFTKS